jgi:hypothetical protein
LASWKAVCTPCALICEYGMSVPCAMCASWLSSVRMRGLEMMRTTPFCLGRGEAHAEVHVAAERAEREAERAALTGAGRGREVHREVRVATFRGRARGRPSASFWS